MELNKTEPRILKKLLNELKKYFEKHICNGIHCNEKCCFC